MRKTIASFAVIGVIFINTGAYGMFEEKPSIIYQKCPHDSWYPEKLPLKPKDNQHTRIDAKLFSEYIKEACAVGQKHGQLMQAINDKDYDTVFSIIEELPDDDSYRLLGAHWYNCADVLYEYEEKSEEEEERLIEREVFVNDICNSKHQSPLLKWVSDILYSASLNSNKPLSNGEKEYNLSESLWFAQWAAQSEKTRNYVCNCPERRFQCCLFGEKKKRAKI
ncbi:MAG: hypothetical protein LBB63_00610 [Holosporaceae bacterium]|nr:hypothetical protein [Holosporaceae bacterium]